MAKNDPFKFTIRIGTNFLFNFIDIYFEGRDLYENVNDGNYYLGGANLGQIFGDILFKNGYSDSWNPENSNVFSDPYLYLPNFLIPDMPSTNSTNNNDTNGGNSTNNDTSNGNDTNNGNDTSPTANKRQRKFLPFWNFKEVERELIVEDEFEKNLSCLMSANSEETPSNRREAAKKVMRAADNGNYEMMGRKLIQFSDKYC